MSQFAALSIAPHSPAGRRRGRDSSFSSLESTPEMPEVPLESIPFSMFDADFGSYNLELPSELALPSPGVDTLPLSSLFGSPSCSFAGFSEREDLRDDVNRFSDGDSFFSLDQNIFH